MLQRVYFVICLLAFCGEETFALGDGLHGNKRAILNGHHSHLGQTQAAVRCPQYLHSYSEKRDNIPFCNQNSTVRIAVYSIETEFCRHNIALTYGGRRVVLIQISFISRLHSTI